MASRDHTVGLLAIKHLTKTNITRLILVLIVVANFSIAKCEEKDNNNEVVKRLKVIEAVSGRSFLGNVYQNGTFRTGNVLWDNLLNECTVKPTVKCLQKNFYSYLDDQLGFNGDVNVTSGVYFKKNNVDINKYSKEANIIYLKGSADDIETRDRSLDDENEISDEDESDTPLEEVTDALYDKGLKFLVTHDMRLELPELVFHGATLKISPRALTKTGALVHVDLEPRVDDNGEGRLFFKKIKKYLKKKLVMAALAIILVIKLIALKLIFVLPLIFGVTTAKKMFLKLLLFLFPALSHIFKLCSWYHNNYHTTKFHHHHHLITHHHKYPHGGHHGPYPASVQVKPHYEPAHALDQPSPDWELSGPGLGSEYIAAGIHRNAIASFKPHENDINDINAWGLGLPPGQSMNIGEYASSNNVASVASPPNKGAIINNNGQGRPVGPPSNPYFNNRNKKGTSKDPLEAEKEALIRAAALAARAPPSPVRDEILRVSAVKLTENNRIKTETELVKQQQKILAASDPDTQAAERFYSALVSRVEAALAPLGARAAPCRLRAVCALYRDPFQHAPHSNLVSNELSKNTDELLPPADSTNAQIYYRYVQAARDGQEQKQCASLYPDCHIDYSKKKKK